MQKLPLRYFLIIKHPILSNCKYDTLKGCGRVCTPIKTILITYSIFIANLDNFAGRAEIFEHEPQLVLQSFLCRRKKSI